ncbi:TetR/AcrR family transcriptional regulator [Nocardia crassostreae]|uniref:TetR/AcrR family transcriptional regulator n=1 Tax=Nocardia crassostreae TaxID=53428 RepID=UPI0008306C3E|nr:TetR/AcrR family transcriptional regulator [Nocardia crassostreae]
MRAGRKPVSRAEAQQQTREDVLDAAEELFLDKGYHETTVAKIAAAAGRTQGAIYANFSSKENLCYEVLQRRYARLFTNLVTQVGSSGEDLEDKIASFMRWWKTLAADTELTVLAAEYALAVRNNPEQRAAATSQIDTLRALMTVAMQQNMARTNTIEQADEAVLAILATSSGLAGMRAAGTIDEPLSAELMARTLRLWSTQLAHTEPDGD